MSRLSKQKIDVHTFVNLLRQNWSTRIFCIESSTIAHYVNQITLCSRSRVSMMMCILCLCQSSSKDAERIREANCLEYDHDRKFDCLGQNACENDGQCFQDNPTCPQTSVCRCAECSYGRPGQGIRRRIRSSEWTQFYGP